MSAKAAYKEYKQVQVNTANREKLLIMLYQGCIKFLRLARKNIEEENIELAHNYNIRSQDIIRELMNTLDRDNGGEIADNLYSLYSFMNRQLIEANVKKVIEPIETVEELMLDLLDS
ncbi:MAG: flagellar export chaperone FliS, partial [bacterium]